MTVISKTLMAVSAVIVENRTVEPQFKFTIMALALDASFLSATNTTKIIEVLSDLLDAMNKVKLSAKETKAIPAKSFKDTC